MMYRKKRWWVLWITWTIDNPGSPQIPPSLRCSLAKLTGGTFFPTRRAEFSVRPLAPPTSSFWLTQEAQVTVTLQLTTGMKQSGEKLLPVTIITFWGSLKVSHTIWSFLHYIAHSHDKTATPKVMLRRRRCVRPSCAHSLSTVSDWSCQSNTETNRDLHFWTVCSYSVSSSPSAFLGLL